MGFGQVSLETVTGTVSRREEEAESEGNRMGNKHRLVLVQLPGYVSSAQCQIPTLASVSLWVPVGIITWLLLPEGLCGLTN